MKPHLRGLLLVGFAGCAVTTAFAESPPSAERGRTLFLQKCQPCHGTEPSDLGHAMLPGTDALRIKYRAAVPAVPAALEQRRDLTPEAIKVYVRRGTWSMPPFRKTELSDADIADIAAWIRKASGG